MFANHTSFVRDKAKFVQKHGHIHAIKADVTSKAELAAAAEIVRQRSGYVNLVIANAGVTGPTLRSLKSDASLTEFRDYLDVWSVEEYNSTCFVNTTAVFLTLVAFLELLDKGNKAGNVEQTSQFVAVSSAGAFSRVPMAGFAYSGSKAATVHIMKQFATKLVPYDIRANVIAPGRKLSSRVLVQVRRCRPQNSLTSSSVSERDVCGIARRKERIPKRVHTCSESGRHQGCGGRGAVPCESSRRLHEWQRASD